MALASASAMLFPFWPGPSLMLHLEWEGRALTSIPSCQPQHANRLTHAATFTPWGGRWVINVTLWGTLSTALRRIPHGWAQNVPWKRCSCFLFSSSALFPSYFLGSLPKINTFEKCLISRSVFFPPKAGLIPVGLVSLPWSKDENKISIYISNPLAYRGFCFLVFTHILFFVCYYKIYLT